MKTVCEKDMCNGCMACRDICQKSCVHIKKSVYAYNAYIDEDVCTHCNRCSSICPVNNEAKFIKSRSWFQGWAPDEIRKRSSSGGCATAIISNFLRENGVVCACSFERGKFGFKIVKDIKDADKFAGSKYVKSDPSGIYNVIKAEIRDHKVLFIGLPCQVAAVISYVGKQYADNLYTIDLVCHGTPSPILLDMFLQEYGYRLKDLSGIRFRQKSSFHVSVNESRLLPNGVVDFYTLGFLKSLFYTENCYKCKFARTERISDITLGDSWGNELPVEEKNKGISLILVQTEKGKELVSNSNLILEPVDLQKAINANAQLRKPSAKPEKRELFYRQLRRNGRFHFAVRKCYRIICLKQDIKMLLSKFGIFFGGGIYQISVEIKEGN